MRVYFRYAFKETFSNLWRNRMMTVAAVLTVAVSLSLVGGALLLKQSAAQASFQWQQGTRVTVWMQPTASTSEITTIKTQLAGLPIVKDCVYFTQAQDFVAAKKLLSLAEASALSVSEVPSSFQCVPTVPSDAFTVQSTLSHEPGVGFAADAAARVNMGLGVAAVTYGAGALNLVNAVAAAYSEKSPVVVLSGGPGKGESRSGFLLHHQAKTLHDEKKRGHQQQNPGQERRRDVVGDQSDDRAGDEKIAHHQQQQAFESAGHLIMGHADGVAARGEDHQSTCLIPARR